MKRAFFAATILAGVLGLAKPAAADAILFDFNGTDPGGQLVITSFDWWAGNGILDETTNTILYQANLNIGQPRTACSGGSIPEVNAFYDCITGVASLSVVPTAIPGQYEVVSGTFQMYAGDTYANDLTGGTAFADETLILNSTIIAPFGTTAFAPSLDAFGNPIIQTLDQFLGDSWGGIQTVIGSGGIANILTQVSYANQDYFKTAPATVSTTITAGGNNLPFTQVDPTGQFFVAGPAGLGVPSVGPVNGGGNRIMTEVDASTTVQLVGAPIPEPATLTLFGLGLLASVGLRRRLLKKRQ